MNIDRLFSLFLMIAGFIAIAVSATMLVDEYFEDRSCILIGYDYHEWVDHPYFNCCRTNTELVNGSYEKVKECKGFKEDLE